MTCRPGGGPEEARRRHGRAGPTQEVESVTVTVANSSRWVAGVRPAHPPPPGGGRPPAAAPAALRLPPNRPRASKAGDRCSAGLGHTAVPAAAS